MITPNITGMSPHSLHAYKGLQYYNKMPDKTKSFYLCTVCVLSSLPTMLGVPPPLPLRGPLVGGKRRRGDRLPPP